MKLSRKHAQDGESVKLWLAELEENHCKTLFKLHEGGPFLISWVSQWQRNVQYFFFFDYEGNVVLIHLFLY